MKSIKRTKAQISTTAIERIYITMRHLFIRGFYKPMGISGQALINELLILQPEIYGSMGEEGAELQGLLYIIDRLPEGIAECRYIHLTADEGLADSNFKKIVPAKRRRNCYRIDRDQVNIEITRGRSDVYDILTHLTFMFIEAEKIARKVMIDDEGETIREWKHLEKIVLNNTHLEGEEREVLIAHLGESEDITILETADNGQEAIQMSVELQPDIVLLDVDIRGMDGITATQHIVEQVPTAQVILMFTQDQSDHQQRCDQAGGRSLSGQTL